MYAPIEMSTTSPRCAANPTRKKVFMSGRFNAPPSADNAPRPGLLRGSRARPGIATTSSRNIRGGATWGLGARRWTPPRRARTLGARLSLPRKGAPRSASTVPPRSLRGGCHPSPRLRPARRDRHGGRRRREQQQRQQHQQQRHRRGRRGPHLCKTAPLVVPTTNFFTDISQKSGIQDQNFVVAPTTPIPINDHSRLAFADINGDGYDDIVMHSLFPNPQAGVPFEHLVFLNNKDGTFTNFSDESGLRNVQAAFFLFGDVDNDGDEDIFAGLDIPLAGAANVLLLNDGQGHFTVKANSGVEGVPGNVVAGSASFADFNGDGKLDLYVANGQTSYIAPDQLFFGNGDGTFTEVTAKALPGNPSQPHNGVVVCDYDNDGDQDVFVSTYGVSEGLGHKILWENDGHGNFKNVALARGFAAQATGNYWLASTGHGTLPEPGMTEATYDGSNGFGIDCDDIDGDGLPDILLATISHPVDSDYSRKWSDPTQVLINQGAAGGFAFKNEFLARGLPFNEGDIDTGLADFDNDGRLDFAITRDNKYEPNYTTPQQLAWLGLFHQEAGGKFTSMGLESGINDTTIGRRRRRPAHEGRAEPRLERHRQRRRSRPPGRGARPRRRAGELPLREHDRPAQHVARRAPHRRRQEGEPRRHRGARDAALPLLDGDARAEVEPRDLHLGRHPRPALRPGKPGVRLHPGGALARREEDDVRRQELALEQLPGDRLREGPHAALTARAGRASDLPHRGRLRRGRRPRIMPWSPSAPPPPVSTPRGRLAKSGSSVAAIKLTATGRRAPANEPVWSLTNPATKGPTRPAKPHAVSIMPKLAPR